MEESNSEAVGGGFLPSISFSIYTHLWFYNVEVIDCWVLIFFHIQLPSINYVCSQFSDVKIILKPYTTHPVHVHHYDIECSDYLLLFPTINGLFMFVLRICYGVDMVPSIRLSSISIKNSWFQSFLLFCNYWPFDRFVRN